MKLSRLFVVSMAATAASWCLAAEKIEGGETVVFTADNAEIVIPAKSTKVVRFAAKEAKMFLSEALGAEVPIVNAPSQGKSSLVLGMNAWSEAVGLSTNQMVRDEFAIIPKGSRVYVFGRDCATTDPEWVLLHGG